MGDWHFVLKDLLRSIRRTMVSVISMTIIGFLLIIDITASWEGHIWEIIGAHLVGGIFLWLAWLYLGKKDIHPADQPLHNPSDWEMIENRLVNLLKDD